MNREQALDKANAIVAEWTGQVKNERGYVHDKWKPTEPSERVAAVLKLAEFLYETAPPSALLCGSCVQPTSGCDTPGVHGEFGLMTHPPLPPPPVTRFGS